MSQKRILLIIPEMRMGGAQRSISKLSLEFSKHHKVWLVIFNKVGGVQYSHGGELISLDVIPTDGILSKMKSFTQRVIRLKKLKKELSIDVSISFLEGADYINILSRAKDKIILSVRGSKQHDETIVGNFFWLRNKILIPWLYRNADFIVAVNQGIAHELCTLYGLKKVKITTIGNFYNTEEIKRLALEPKSRDLNRLYTDPVLIVTGRLAPEKGLKKLLLVFHQLKTKNQRLRLVVVGDGLESLALMKLASQLNLRAHTGSDFDELPDVIFLGSQSNVFKFLTGATLFLMNSSSEGFPNGLAEAMICGVPVVSSDCPYGPREILAPDFPFSSSVSKPYFSPCGVLMPMIHSDEEIKIWVDTLHTILGNNDALFNFAKMGIEKMNLFDQKIITQQWYTLLEECV